MAVADRDGTFRCYEWPGGCGHRVFGQVPGIGQGGMDDVLPYLMQDHGAGCRAALRRAALPEGAAPPELSKIIECRNIRKTGCLAICCGQRCGVMRHIVDWLEVSLGDCMAQMVKRRTIGVMDDLCASEIFQYPVNHRACHCILRQGKGEIPGLEASVAPGFLKMKIDTSVDTVSREQAGQFVPFGERVCHENPDLVFQASGTGWFCK